MVFGNLFGTLQEEAYSAHRIAAVTPLTNNGTIASLFNFPSGQEMPPLLEPEEVAQAVQSLNLSSPQVWAPTGVGFCVYLRRKAISNSDCLTQSAVEAMARKPTGAKPGKWLAASDIDAMFVFHSGTKSFSIVTRMPQSRETANTCFHAIQIIMASTRLLRAHQRKFHRLRILLRS
jgi:hypothetical protein